MARSAPRLRVGRPIAPVHEPAGAQENYGQGRGGRPWRRKREHVLQRDGFTCRVCLASGVVTLADEVDHIIPRSQGGTDETTNLQAICKTCHRAKTAGEASAGRRGGRGG